MFIQSIFILLFVGFIVLLINNIKINNKYKKLENGNPSYTLSNEEFETI